MEGSGTKEVFIHEKSPWLDAEAQRVKSKGGIVLTVINAYELVSEQIKNQAPGGSFKLSGASLELCVEETARRLLDAGAKLVVIDASRCREVVEVERGDKFTPQQRAKRSRYRLDDYASDPRLKIVTK